MKHLKLSKASEKSNMYSNRSGNYMMIDADWIESSIQNYIELKRKININREARHIAKRVLCVRDSHNTKKMSKMVANRKQTLN